MGNKNYAFVVAIISLAVSLASCGGSSDGAPEDEDPIPHAVTIADLYDGAITASAESVPAGATVDLAIEPIRGNKLVAGSLAVVTGDGSKVTLAIIGESAYRFTMPNCAVTIHAAFEAIYKVGDTGPGGGIVFYDRGSYLDTSVDSWRYMELTSGNSRANGYTLLSSITTPSDIGSGKENTQVGYEAAGNNPACIFGQCLSYRGGDFSDWYLPSEEELRAAAWSYCFLDNNWFFCSTIRTDEGGAIYANMYPLDGLYVGNPIKYIIPTIGLGGYYRPCRRF